MTSLLPTTCLQLTSVVSTCIRLADAAASRLIIATLFVSTIGWAEINAADQPLAWKQHTIDDTSRGADGARPLDVNGDGRLDFATAWEEGGVIRAYLQPARKLVRDVWPSVTVGKVKSPEDAVFVDLDGDGATDVVSSCEGRQKSVFVHWAPRKRSDFLDASKWKTEPIPSSVDVTSWMFCLAMDVDGQNGLDLVVGSKAGNAQVGWFEAPATDRRDLAKWKYHAMCQAGWIMTLSAMDVDHDGDQDIVMSDRKGSSSGCFWLENAGPTKSREKWARHPIGALGLEVMFMGAGDLNGDGRTDFVVPVRGQSLQVLLRSHDKHPKWKRSTIAMPANTGTGKGAAIIDVNLDGRADVVYSCENSSGKTGVGWLTRAANDDVANAKWTAFDISGPERGIKFDLLETVDLDGDGDLDVITCEERHNLGVIWYENPTR